MSFLINPFVFAQAGGGGGDPTLGALVTRAGTAFSGVSGDPVQWASEVYDGGYFDAGANSRLTIPSGVSLVRILAAINANVGQIFRVRKNGGGFAGQGKALSSGIYPEVSLVSGIVAVSAGDYFELVKDDTLTTAPDADGNWFAVEYLDPATQYALVAKSSSQAIAANTNTALTWQTEIADVGGWFASGSPTRFTVPSGVTRVRLTAGLKNNGVTSGDLRAFFTKNGSEPIGMPFNRDSTNSQQKFLTLASAVLEVAAGDYFEMMATGASAETIPAADEVWFCIEEVPDHSRALASRSGSQVITSNTTTAVTLNAETYDTDSIHDTATNNSRLTVPTGYTQARLAARVQEVGAGLVMWVGKNGDATPLAGCPREGGSDTSVSSMGTWIDVTPGDYFEMFVFDTVAMTITYGWLSAEFR